MALCVSWVLQKCLGHRSASYMHGCGHTCVCHCASPARSTRLFVHRDRGDRLSFPPLTPLVFAYRKMHHAVAGDWGSGIRSGHVRLQRGGRAQLCVQVE